MESESTPEKRGPGRSAGTYDPAGETLKTTVSKPIMKRLKDAAPTPTARREAVELALELWLDIRDGKRKMPLRSGE